VRWALVYVQRGAQDLHASSWPPTGELSRRCSPVGGEPRRPLCGPGTLQRHSTVLRCSTGAPVRGVGACGTLWAGGAAGADPRPWPHPQRPAPEHSQRHAEQGTPGREWCLFPAPQGGAVIAAPRGEPRTCPPAAAQRLQVRDGWRDHDAAAHWVRAASARPAEECPADMQRTDQGEGAISALRSRAPRCPLRAHCGAADGSDRLSRTAWPG